MGPGICFPLLSTRGNLDADGSQGKNLFQSPQVGVAGLQKMERRLQLLSLWEWQAESTESAGEGDHSNSSYVLSTWHEPGGLLPPPFCG